MKPQFNRYQDWRRLAIFIKAYALLLLMALSLRLFRFRRVYEFLYRISKVPANSTGDQEEILVARELARIVQAAANRSIQDATCLRKSLVLWLLLRQRGINSDIIIGVQNKTNNFMGHAWVEIKEEVVNDSPDVRQQYTVMEWQKHLNLPV